MSDDSITKIAVHEAKGPVSFIGKSFTKELVSEYIAYNAKTGSFERLKTSGTKKAGDKVGVINGKYLQISICAKRIRGHQLAWFLTYGYIPKTIDHINGNGLDNKLCNLREVTTQQNCQNIRKAPKHNTTGFMGVSYYKASKKYSAQISLGGKTKHLGYFISPEIAYQTYLMTKRKLHTSCTI
jgi:hypothetical protein